MIVVVSGNPRPHSRTLHLAEEVGAALAARLDQPVPGTVDVAVLGPRLLVPGHGDLVWALDRLRAATLLVVATPTYKGSYTGVLKVLLDALPAGGLAGAAAVTVVTAGAPSHAAAAQRHLTGLLGELGAVVVTPGLAVVEADLDCPCELATRYASSLVDLGEMVPRLTGLSGHSS